MSALDEMSPSTKQTYSRELKEFLDWAEETPEGLVGYWIETQDMSLSDHLKDYIKKLTDEGHKGGKQNSVVKALKKFFKVNGFTPTLDTKNMIGEGGVRPAKLEEICEVLKYGKVFPRDTALIAISKDSGLRVSDITRIKFKHIQSIIDNPRLVFFGFQISVHKTRNKKREALPCLGSDAITHLRAWLRKRATLGITSDAEDYVFVNIRAFNEYDYYGKHRGASTIGGRMTESNASVVIGNLFKRAGYNDLSSNSLRKFNTTMLSLSGMGENLIKAMHGKHQQSSTDHYLKATAPQMLEVYKEHYEALSVESAEMDAEVRERVDAKVKMLADMVMSLSSEIEVMKQEKDPERVLKRSEG